MNIDHPKRQVPILLAQIEKLEAICAVYREALEHIVKHLEITAGSMAPVSGIYIIATKALSFREKQ